VPPPTHFFLTLYVSVDKQLLHTLTAEVLKTITSVTEIIKCIIYLVEIQIYKAITFPFVLYVCACPVIVSKTI
jgi:hypothetical protein